MSLSLIPIHLFKNLSTVHNFLPCSLCNSFKSSIYLFFLTSMASLLFFLLSLSLSLSLTRPHEAEERRTVTWWQTVLAGIGPYRPFQRPFLPKLAQIGTNWCKSENPKKKKPTQHRHTVSSIVHHTPRRCTSGVGAVALELHPCFLGSDTYWTQ